MNSETMKTDDPIHHALWVQYAHIQLPLSLLFTMVEDQVTCPPCLEYGAAMAAHRKAIIDDC